MPNVDLNLLPEVVRRYASELSSTIGADPLGSAFAMIVAASGLVDARSRLHIVDGFEVPRRATVVCMLLDNLSSFGCMRLPYPPKSFFALRIQVYFHALSL
jgi:hypothetical protein